MISLSKKLYIIFISSTLFFGIQAMKSHLNEINFDMNEKEVENLALKILKEKIDEELQGMNKLSGPELLTTIIDKFLDDSKMGELNVDEKTIMILPVIIEAVKPIYQNLTPATKKFLTEFISAAKDVINKKITESKNENEKNQLKELIANVAPLIELIHDNNNAGIVAQFSLLDVSGKVIVGLSLPLALYGGYKAVQALTHKDDTQEQLQ